jgi:hypothetical protein
LYWAHDAVGHAAEGDGFVFLPIFLISKCDANDVGLMDAVGAPSDVQMVFEEPQILDLELFCAAIPFDGEVFS